MFSLRRRTRRGQCNALSLPPEKFVKDIIPQHKPPYDVAAVAVGHVLWRDIFALFLDNQRLTAGAASFILLAPFFQTGGKKVFHPKEKSNGNSANQTKRFPAKSRAIRFSSVMRRSARRRGREVLEVALCPARRGFCFRRNHLLEKRGSTADEHGWTRMPFRCKRPAVHPEGERNAGRQIRVYPCESVVNDCGIHIQRPHQFLKTP